jgi:hypothetical protein
MLNGKVGVYSGGNFIGSNKNNYFITLSVDEQKNFVIHIIGMDASYILFNTGSAFSWSKE